MTTTFVNQQLRSAANMTQAYQNLRTHQIAQARQSLHSPNVQRKQSTIDYQACSQPWEPLFARTLGETEDFAAACKAAKCTPDQGERALRNPSVCSLAESSHKASCEKLVAELKEQLPTAQQTLVAAEKAYRQSKSRGFVPKVFGTFYDAEKLVKKITDLINSLELRKCRPAFVFKNSKWQVATGRNER